MSRASDNRRFHYTPQVEHKQHDPVSSTLRSMKICESFLETITKRLDGLSGRNERVLHEKRKLEITYEDNEQKIRSVFIPVPEIKIDNGLSAEEQKKKLDEYRTNLTQTISLDIPRHFRDFDIKNLLFVYDTKSVPQLHADERFCTFTVNEEYVEHCYYNRRFGRTFEYYDWESKNENHVNIITNYNATIPEHISYDGHKKYYNIGFIVPNYCIKIIQERLNDGYFNFRYPSIHVCEQYQQLLDDEAKIDKLRNELQILPEEINSMLEHIVDMYHKIHPNQQDDQDDYHHIDNDVSLY